MAHQFLSTNFTAGVLRAQETFYGRSQKVPPAPGPDELGAQEEVFIQRRDSFYMATTNSDGWPYLQHRGGPAGFLRVLGPHQLGFADFKGNRQMLTTGNLDGNDRVALFLMDYPNRERQKILGHARVLDAREHAALADQLSPTPELRSKIERVFLIEVVSFDWNCPQYITPRYTEAEMEQAVAPLKARIAELEAQLRLRDGHPHLGEVG